MKFVFWLLIVGALTYGYLFESNNGCAADHTTCEVLEIVAVPVKVIISAGAYIADQAD